MSPVFIVTLLYISSCICIDGNVQESVLIDELENEIKEALENINVQAVELDVVKSRLRENEAMIESIKDTMQSKRQSSTGVGFTATLSNTLTKLSDHQVIKFDSLITNVGNGYSPASGIFTCPVSGLYEFSASIVSNGANKNADVDMVRDGIRILYIHATLFEYDTGSQVVISRCAKGQRIWIRHTQGNTDSKELLGGHCTFSGHLIYAD